MRSRACSTTGAVRGSFLALLHPLLLDGWFIGNCFILAPTSLPDFEWTCANNLKFFTPSGVPKDDAIRQVALDAPHRPDALIAEEDTGGNKVVWKLISRSEKAVETDQAVLCKKRPEKLGIRWPTESVESEIKLAQYGRNRLPEFLLRSLQSVQCRRCSKREAVEPFFYLCCEVHACCAVSANANIGDPKLFIRWGAEPLASSATHW